MFKALARLPYNESIVNGEPPSGYLFMADLDPRRCSASRLQKAYVAISRQILLGLEQLIQSNRLLNVSRPPGYGAENTVQIMPLGYPGTSGVFVGRDVSILVLRNTPYMAVVSGIERIGDRVLYLDTYVLALSAAPLLYGLWVAVVYAREHVAGFIERYASVRGIRAGIIGTIYAVLFGGAVLAGLAVYSATGRAVALLGPAAMPLVYVAARWGRGRVSGFMTILAILFIVPGLVALVRIVRAVLEHGSNAMAIMTEITGSYMPIPEASYLLWLLAGLSPFYLFAYVGLSARATTIVTRRLAERSSLYARVVLAPQAELGENVVVARRAFEYMFGLLVVLMLYKTLIEPSGLLSGLGYYFFSALGVLLYGAADIAVLAGLAGLIVSVAAYLRALEPARRFETVRLGRRVVPRYRGVLVMVLLDLLGGLVLGILAFLALIGSIAGFWVLVEGLW